MKDTTGQETEHKEIWRDFNWGSRGGGNGDMAIFEKAAANNFSELVKKIDLSFQKTAQILTRNRQQK